MTAKEIYRILRAGGLSRAGALGMLGNMMAESTLKPNIAQRGMTNLSDADYTWSADEGRIDFVNDKVGYGLCQWTLDSRKQALLEYANECGVSVGDGTMQCDFALMELQTDFADLFKTLCTSTDIDLCSDLICTKFERPAVNNLAERRSYAHKFGAEIPDIEQPAFRFDWKIALIQYVMQFDGYWGEPDGLKSAAFFDKLHEYVADMEVIR